MKYERLFTPGRVGSMTIRNRIIMEPHQTGLTEPGENGGRVTDALLAYYKRRADGGVGAIVTELACVDSVTGLQSLKSIRADADYSIEEFAKVADAIHSGGAKAFVQINHPGSEANGLIQPKENFVSASPIPSHRARGVVTRELTADEIHVIADKYGAAARRLQLGGIDGVAIHGAHHYLIHQFLSAKLNRRTDEYGGTLENRARFLHEVLEAIRRYCGEDYPIMLRLSGEEYVGKYGQHLDETLKVFKWAEEWGVDLLDVSASGSMSHGSQSVEPPSFDQGWRKHLPKAAKQVVNIPVCAVSLVREPAYAEWLLANGYTDFVGSARAHLADPDWSRKAYECRDYDITRCISCMRCYEAISHNSGAVACSVNPEAGLESQLKPLNKNGAGRKVAVIGGGPAGMEAASVLGARGFAVTLYEKLPYLGGQVYLGSRSTSKHKNAWLIETLERRMTANGVRIIKNFAPTIADLEAEGYYAVIDAAGAVPLIPKFIEGADSCPILVTPPEILRGEVDYRDKSIVVIGSGFTGLEVAEQLSERSKGNAVMVVEMAPFIAPDGSGSLRNDIVDVLDRNQVVFMLNRKCAKVDEKGVYMESTVTGEKYFLPCDVIVMSIGVRSANPFSGELEKHFERVVKVGDENKPARIHEATRSGWEAAINLD